MAKDKEVTVLQRILLILNTLFNQLLAVITVYVLWVVIKNNKVNTMFWHVILSTIAYIPLMAIALVLFASENQWSQYILRTKKQWIHGILLIFATTALCVGIGLEVHAKKKGHFKSKHAKYGLASWVLVLVSVLLGVLAHYSQTLKRILPPVWIKFLHNIIGLAAYVTGLVSLWYGLDYGSFARFVTAHELRATQWLMVVAVAWSCKDALKSAYDQIKAILGR